MILEIFFELMMSIPIFPFFGGVVKIFQIGTNRGIEWCAAAQPTDGGRSQNKTRKRVVSNAHSLRTLVHHRTEATFDSVLKKQTNWRFLKGSCPLDDKNMPLKMTNIFVNPWLLTLSELVFFYPT